MIRINWYKKDNLTWEDCKKIVEIADNLLCENIELCHNAGEQAYYEEVLKRYQNETV